MTNFQFEQVTVPEGQFFAWGPTPGQVVTCVVTGYTPTGGTDFNQQPCPQIEAQLIDAAVSVDRTGAQTPHQAGDPISLTCGQANLKRAIMAANPTVGDVLRITYSGTSQHNGNTVKVFSVEIARQAGHAMLRQHATAGLQPATPPAAQPGSYTQQPAGQQNPFGQPAGQGQPAQPWPATPPAGQQNPFGQAPQAGGNPFGQPQQPPF